MYPKALTLFALGLLACACGASEGRAGRAPAYDPANAPSAITHDQARESHMGPPAVGAAYQGAGVRNAGDETPAWWGRGDPPVDDADRAPSSLSGPLLLPADGTGDAANGDAANDDDAPQDRGDIDQ